MCRRSSTERTMAKLCIIYKINASMLWYKQKKHFWKLSLWIFVHWRRDEHGDSSRQLVQSIHITLSHMLDCRLFVWTHWIITLQVAWLGISPSIKVSTLRHHVQRGIHLEIHKIIAIQSRGLSAWLLSSTMDEWIGERKENINQRLYEAPGQLKARGRIDTCN